MALKQKVEIIGLISVSDIGYVYLASVDMRVSILLSHKKLSFGTHTLFLDVDAQKEKSLASWLNIIAKDTVYLVLNRNPRILRDLHRDARQKINQVLSLKSSEFSAGGMKARCTDNQNAIFRCCYTIASLAGLIPPDINEEEFISFIYENDRLPALAFHYACLQLPLFIIALSRPIDFLAKLTPEERRYYLDVFLGGGYEIDSSLLLIAKAGLVRPAVNEGFEKIAKYRGHTLLIKNSKTGMTTLAARVGLNISAASFAALEGYSEAEGGVQYSILHEQTGLVNFDEFLMMKDNIVLKLYNFLEQGVYTTGKAARLISNYSCAQCVFTANPAEFEIENENEDGLLASSDETDAALATFRGAIRMLTMTAKAMGSRFGLVVFNPEMPVAKLEEHIPPAEYENAQEIIAALLEFHAGTFFEIFNEKRVLEWLETPNEAYAQKVKTLARDITDLHAKRFWEGHADAHRHMRGMALCVALIDVGVVEGRFEVDALIASAETTLREIEQENLASMQRLIAREKTFTKSDVALLPDYVRLLLDIYCENGEAATSFNTLIARFEKIPEEVREKKYGAYAYPSRFKKKIRYEKIKRILYPLVDVSLRDGDIVLSSKNFEDVKKIVLGEAIE